MCELQKKVYEKYGLDSPEEDIIKELYTTTIFITDNPRLYFTKNSHIDSKKMRSEYFPTWERDKRIKIKRLPLDCLRNYAGF